ncbi:hypothetical protein APP86_14085 [Salmonella enterica subsp. houtenae]|nr:hypothetical protein APP86_14085 [Salmonella enterica subsp. houtenae]
MSPKYVALLFNDNLFDTVFFGYQLRFFPVGTIFMILVYYTILHLYDITKQISLLFTDVVKIQLTSFTQSSFGIIPGI